MSIARWYAKANALAPAMPGASMRSIAVLLSVGEHETRNGDAWPGENNVGATTRRPLHADERAVLAAAGIAPTVGPSHIAIEAQAKMAIAAAVSAGTIADPGPGCALHCDSTPTGGPYFVFFAAFPTEEEGFAYFASFFKTAAEKQAIADGNPSELAAAMFHAGYYTGFHKNDPAANIADYAAALNRIFPSIVAALADWTPGADPPEPDVGSVAWVQGRLNALGVVTPPLVEDGALGPKTAAALKAYQASNGLDVTGTIDSETVNSLTS